MKVILCLFAVLAVALAKPQYNAEQLWSETLQIAQQKGYIRPDETLLEFQVAPIVNQLENVPGNQPVQLNQILTPLDAPQVYPYVQRSVDENLARF
uniref:Uncharacterized protein n=1 Tax=Anopheles farauti TaxID=69004 RepID=A0A182QAT4_9DIPT